MKVQDDVPYSVEDLTADWLSRGLQASGVLEGSAVTDFTMDVLGDQVGKADRPWTSKSSTIIDL